MKYETNNKIVPVICVMQDNIRLSAKDYKTLFGDKELEKESDLGQEGEWLAKERLFVEMGNGKHAELSVIMPCVAKTTISMCSSTLARLGGKADLVAPDKAMRSDRCMIENPDPYHNNVLEKRNSIMRPMRHIHLPIEIREVYGINLGDTVIAEINGKRGVILDQVIVVDSANRLGKELELHIDQDEGYAFGVFEDMTYAKIYVKGNQNGNKED